MSNTNFQTFHQMGDAVNSVIKQATGRRPVENIDMDYVTVAQNTVVEQLDIEGAVVTFDMDRAVPFQKLLANIEPVQDLHGQDAPYPPGGGKNLWDELYEGIGTTIVYKALNVGEGQFTLSTTNPEISSGVYNLFLLAGNVSSGALSTNGVYKDHPRTVTAVDGYVTIAYRNYTGGTSPVDSKTQLEAGSSATAYAPYSNICHISGWTGCNVTIAPTTDPDDPDKVVKSISWETEAGTVCGGTLDVLTGVLTVDHYMGTYNGSENWIGQSGSLDYYVLWGQPEAISNVDLTQCANYLVVGGNTYTNFGKFRVQTNGALVVGNVIFNGEHKFASTSELKAFLAENPLQVCYKITIPQTYQLTPQEVNTLVGTNNVYADTGDVEIAINVYKEMF